MSGFRPAEHGWPQVSGDEDDPELQAALAASLREAEGHPAQDEWEHVSVPQPSAPRNPLPAQEPSDPQLFGFPSQTGIHRRTRGAAQPGAATPGDPPPVVTFPPEVREIPIQWKDPQAPEGGQASGAQPVYHDKRGLPQVQELDSGFRDTVPSHQVALVEEEGGVRYMEDEEGHRSPMPEGRGFPGGDEGISSEGGQLLGNSATAFAQERRMGMDLPGVGGPGAGAAHQVWGVQGAQGGGGWHEEDEDPELQAALALSIQSKEEEDMLRKALEAGGPAAAVPASGAVNGHSFSAEMGDAAMADVRQSLPVGAGVSAPAAEHEPGGVGLAKGAPGPGLVTDNPEDPTSWRDRRAGAGPVAEAQLGHVGDEGEEGAGPRFGPGEVGINGPVDEHALAGISEEERQMAAMYEAALFGVPYAYPEGAGAVGIPGAPGLVTHLPDPSPLPPRAYQDHSQLLQQWQEQQRPPAQGGLPDPTVPGQEPYGRDMSASMQARQLLQPRPRPRGYVHEYEDEEGDTLAWEAERQRRAQEGPDAKTIEQRLLREQQDDEYQMSLLADREKEERAKREAEEARRRVEDEEARRVAEEKAKKEEEEAYEAILAVKASRLPPEPDAPHPDAITILVRTPDGSRRSRRFLRTTAFQALLDFIETERISTGGTYQLVRQFPNRVFTLKDGAATFEDLGLTSKQEALFIRVL